MNPEKILLEELGVLCEYMDVDSIEISAPKIARFTQLFITDPVLVPIANEIWNSRHGDFAPLNSLLKKLFRKTSSICKSLQAYIKEKNINDPNIINSLPWIKQDLSVVAFFMQLTILINIFKFLLRDTRVDHRPFIRQHARIDEANLQQPITFDINTDELSEENNHFNRIKLTREWWVLDNLTDFLWIYDQKQHKERKAIAHKQHPIYDLTLTVRNNALNRAIGPTKDTQFPEQGFNPRYFKMYMQQLHLYAQKRLIHAMSIPQTKITDWSYCPKKRYFSCQGKIAKFRNFALMDKKKSNKNPRSAYGYPGKILEDLSGKYNNRNLPRYFKNLYEDIVGTAPEDDGMQAMYDACVHINQKLFAECGLKDFLDFDMSFVRINPIYLP